MSNYFIPRIRDILFFAIFTAVIFLGPKMLNMDGDLPRHLAIGKYVLSGRLPPTEDIFSYTKEGSPFAPHKWFSGVLFYIAYMINGEKGIVLLSALVLASAFTLIYSDQSNQSGSSLTTLFVTVWGAAISSLHWIARPHLFTMLLVAIWLILTDRLVRGERIKWWVFPLIMLLWNNIHGEYIAGFLISASYIIGWVWDFLSSQGKQDPDKKIFKRLSLSLVTSAIVTVFNPISLRAWTTVTSWLGNRYLMEKTQETASPNFLNSEFYVLLIFIGFSIFVLSVSRKRPITGQAISLAGFTIMVLNSARNVHIFGVVAPFVIAGSFSELINSPLIKKIEENTHLIEKPLRGITYPIIIFIAACIILNTTAIGSIERFSPTYFPIQAVEWLKSNPQRGNMFNPFDWGGYISFTLWPEYKVFIDSQGDIYGEAFIREYEQVSEVRDNWNAVLEKYNVSWALIEADSPLATELLAKGWIVQYQDETAIILKK